jgi:hypothetical protein
MLLRKQTPENYTPRANFPLLFTPSTNFTINIIKVFQVSFKLKKRWNVKQNKVIFNIWETVSFLIFWHALPATLQTTKLYSFRARNDKEFLDFWHNSRYSNVNSLLKITQIAYLIPEAWDVDLIDVRLTVHFLKTRISVHVETKDWKGVGTRAVAKSLEFTKMQAFGDVTTCLLVDSYRCFEGKWHFIVRVKKFSRFQRLQFVGKQTIPTNRDVLSTTVLLDRHRNVIFEVSSRYSYQLTL